jgi:hypothetical protein
MLDSHCVCYLWLLCVSFSTPFNILLTHNTASRADTRAPLVVNLYLAEEQALLNSVGADRAQKQTLFVQKYSSLDPACVRLANDLGCAFADLATARGQL